MMLIDNFLSLLIDFWMKMKMTIHEKAAILYNKKIQISVVLTESLNKLN